MVQKSNLPKYSVESSVIFVNQWKPQPQRVTIISSHSPMTTVITLTLGFANTKMTLSPCSKFSRLVLRKRLVKVSRFCVLMVEASTHQMPSIPFWPKMVLNRKLLTHIHPRKMGCPNAENGKKTQGGNSSIDYSALLEGQSNERGLVLRQLATCLLQVQ